MAEPGFVCNQCGKEFRRVDHVQRHKRTVHQRRFRYTCPTCHRGYEERGKFKTHLATHTSQPKYDGASASSYLAASAAAAAAAAGAAPLSSTAAVAAAVAAVEAAAAEFGSGGSQSGSRSRSSSDSSGNSDDRASHGSGSGSSHHSEQRGAESSRDWLSSSHTSLNDSSIPPRTSVDTQEREEEEVVAGEEGWLGALGSSTITSMPYHGPAADSASPHFRTFQPQGQPHISLTSPTAVAATQAISASES